jgi:hypothetical protein
MFRKPRGLWWAVLGAGVIVAAMFVAGRLGTKSELVPTHPEEKKEVGKKHRS